MVLNNEIDIIKGKCFMSLGTQMTLAEEVSNITEQDYFFVLNT